MEHNEQSSSVVTRIWATFTDKTSNPAASSLTQDDMTAQHVNTFTFGEIIFLTILLSIIALAIGLAIQDMLHRRNLQYQEREMADVEIKDNEQTYNIKNIDGPMIGSGKAARRNSIESSTSNNSYARDHNLSLASRVSKDYKFAAIDHMNMIAMRGRHDR